MIPLKFCISRDSKKVEGSEHRGLDIFKLFETEDENDSITEIYTNSRLTKLK